MGHLSKIQRHLGERLICMSLEMKGKQYFCKCNPVTQSCILVEGMWLTGKDGMTCFSTCFPVEHTVGVSHQAGCLSLW